MPRGAEDERLRLRRENLTRAEEQEQEQLLSLSFFLSFLSLFLVFCALGEELHPAVDEAYRICKRWFEGPEGILESQDLLRKGEHLDRRLGWL